MVSSRRRRDRVIAAGLAVIVAALVFIVWFTSDARHVNREVAEGEPLPTAMSKAPTAISEVWRQQVPSQFTPIISPYGTVVTGDDHAVTGYDIATGNQRWRYERTNIPLCALGSGDTTPTNIDQGGAVRGILTGYSKSGLCSELTLLDPITGDRRKERTSFNELGSEVVFGGPYATFAGPTLMELWRFDLVRTIQYGDQPTPTKSGTKHLGCEFMDVALADKQFATIEKCIGKPNLTLVVNWADPGTTTIGKEKGWDSFKFEPRGTVDLGVTDARILGITADDIAVLIGGDSPQLVTYSMVDPAPPSAPSSSAGASETSTPATTATSEAPKPEPVLTEISRVAIDVDDKAIAEITTRATPTTIDEPDRYSIIGDTLVAVRGKDLEDHWTLAGVLGKVAVAGDDILAPVAAGIAVINADSGEIRRTIELNREGYQGPVDVAVSESFVVETRGNDVVVYRVSTS